MAHQEFRPRKAVRADKREAFEAVGRSFCKTLAELITNSDTSAKQKHGLRHASGLVEHMFSTKKGTQLDTAALRSKLADQNEQRLITVDLVRTKTSRRPKGEVVVVDQGTGMSSAALKTILREIEADRSDIAGSSERRGIFGKGLSDVLRAYAPATIHTYDGNELTIATGEWRKTSGWTIAMDDFDNPARSMLQKYFLNPDTTGSAVRLVIGDRSRCSVPQPSHITYRLANFYMLRLIASDPNVRLLLRQHTAGGVTEDRITYDWPVGQVIDVFTRDYNIEEFQYGASALRIDFLVLRADSNRPLRGLDVDKDARENGMMIVDDNDAVYDLTFGDPDFEKADFLSHVYGIVRVHGLRRICEECLNDPEHPTSPIRDDRDGFNRDHPFSRALLQFITDSLRPLYDKERDRLKEREASKWSAETQRRLEEALKQLNKYFHDVTELGGSGSGTDDELPEEPKQAVSFLPQQTRLIAGRPREVLLLIREKAIRTGSEVVATASEGFSVQPETERLSRKDSPRWKPHSNFLAIRVSVSSDEIGKSGTVHAVVEGRDGDLLEAKLRIADVLGERVIEVPKDMEFRPRESTGRPGRRNNLVLYLNPDVITLGHYVQTSIMDSVGNVSLINELGQSVDRLDIKLTDVHRVSGQRVLRVLIPWRDTGWNQRARVMARVRVSGSKPLMTTATIRLDEPDDAGFFKEVKYDDLGKETLAPSRFAAGVITINAKDPLNAMIFGDGTNGSLEDLKARFDRELLRNPLAQQRVAHLLLEEASFRALEHKHSQNELYLANGREVSAVHQEVDKYKYQSALAVHRALVRSRL